MRWIRVRMICFDWNGTLLNDASFMFEGVKAIFRHFGKTEPKFDEYREEIGEDAKGFYNRRGITAPWETLDAIMNAHLATLSPPNLMPDTRTALEVFRRRGMPLALVSLREPQALAQDLEYFKLTPFFISVQGGSHDKTSALRRLRMQFGCKENELALVSDTYKDLLAARSAACVAIGFTKGYGTIASLRRGTPRYMIDDLLVLTRLIAFAKN